MGDYDHVQFMALECLSQYYSDLPRTKLLLERDIFMDKVLEKYPSFFDSITTSRWICFTQNPFESNNHWVQEFYMNLSVVSLSNPVMMIRWKKVNFGTERVNRVCLLPNVDMAYFQAKGCETKPRTTLLKIRGEGVPGHSKKRKVNSGKPTAEEPEFCRPSAAGPLEDIGIDIRAIMELVSGLPQGTGESSSWRHSYVSFSDYEKYKKE
ncbi:hypothetical protein FXO38_27664 [Capsicum annuum]|nr:hypothetical protein FXO38_27664 [Capsicum annuum]KAF3635189.1 hypothetical protein FXO37_26127 [Capsicum annuum]